MKGIRVLLTVELPVWYPRVLHKQTVIWLLSESSIGCAASSKPSQQPQGLRAQVAKALVRKYSLSAFIQP